MNIIRYYFEVLILPIEFKFVNSLYILIQYVVYICNLFMLYILV